MYWWMWILGAVLAFFAVRFLWRGYNHPSHVLGRQAANMNWVAVGRVSDGDGYYNVKLSRDGMEAIISFKNENVTLVKPSRETPFKDFIELERWFAADEQHSTDDEEIAYYEAVNDFITSHGFYESLLELQGTDKEYCIASMKMYKAGYFAGQSEKVVGALTMDSVKQYHQNRKLAILFLLNLEKRFLDNQNEEENSHNASKLTENSDNDDYHPELDQATEQVEEFLITNEMFVPLRGNGKDIKTIAELLMYIASYLAMLNSGINIPPVSWNSFKRSIENRILATNENPPSLSESVVTSDSVTFAHYTSEYWGEMTRMEELVLNNRINTGEIKLNPLARYILRSLGSNAPGHLPTLLEYLLEISQYASKKIVPKVVRVFG